MINRLFRWLEGQTDAFPPHWPEKPPTSLHGFVLHYTRPFLPLVMIGAAFAAAVAVLEVFLFSFIGNLVDWLVGTDQDRLWAEHGLALAGIAVLILIVLPILKFVYVLVIHQGLLGNFAMRIRWQAHRYLLRQSMEFFQDDFAGRVATKMMQTSLGVRDTVLRITDVLVYVGVYFTAAVVLFASSDLRLTAPMLIWLVGYLIALRYFVPKLKDLSREQAERRSTVTGRVVDSYTNISTVKMFAHAEHEDAYARGGMELFLDNVYRQMRMVTLMTTTLQILNSLLLFSVIGLAIWLWQQGSVSAGALAFAAGLVLRLQGMSEWILWEVSDLFENIGVVQDGVETIAQDLKVTDAVGAPALSVRRGAIDYRNIRFNYGDQRQDVVGGVIDDLSLNIEAGEKIGLVGRSGAGKSTLVNLLLRFYDIEAGEILIDGQNIAGVKQSSLRASIGMVTQDTSLLHRSVYDNIAYGDANASQQQVLEAARLARADEFIRELVDGLGRTGYEAHVGERGVKLSGGQRQRIAIARVLLKNAPILVLDEATSALDSEVEVAIQESLYQLMQGKTVIAIAHRLSTIAAMDRLVVMDQGRIVEQGSHDTLIATGGLYADLWAHQSGGFLGADSDQSQQDLGRHRA